MLKARCADAAWRRYRIAICTARVARSQESDRTKHHPVSIDDTVIVSIGSPTNSVVEWPARRPQVGTSSPDY
jgi:hypothetical protein